MRLVASDGDPGQVEGPKQGVHGGVCPGFASTQLLAQYRGSYGAAQPLGAAGLILEHGAPTLAGSRQQPLDRRLVDVRQVAREQYGELRCDVGSSTRDSTRRSRSGWVFAQPPHPRVVGQWSLRADDETCGGSGDGREYAIEYRAAFDDDAGLVGAEPRRAASRQDDRVKGGHPPNCGSPANMERCVSPCTR